MCVEEQYSSEIILARICFVFYLVDFVSFDFFARFRCFWWQRGGIIIVAIIVSRLVRFYINIWFFNLLCSFHPDLFVSRGSFHISDSILWWSLIFSLAPFILFHHSLCQFSAMWKGNQLRTNLSCDFFSLLLLHSNQCNLFQFFMYYLILLSPSVLSLFFCIKCLLW